MEIVTTRCSEWKHPEFRLAVDPAIPDCDIDAFKCWLEESVASGARFEAGQIIQLASMLMQISSADGHLVLEEPDLRSVPIVWTAGITRSLRLTRLQKDVAESVGLGVGMDFPSIRHSVLIGVDLSSHSDAFILDRLEPAASDSGWFLGRLDSQVDYNEPANLYRTSVYDAFVRWPKVAMFFALPAGSRVEMSPNQLALSRNGLRLELRTGSFLDQALAKGKLWGIDSLSAGATIEDRPP
jgi:hypothetical protein